MDINLYMKHHIVADYRHCPSSNATDIWVVYLYLAVPWPLPLAWISLSALIHFLSYHVNGCHCFFCYLGVVGQLLSLIAYRVYTPVHMHVP